MTTKLYELPDRAVLRVRGAKALKFLHDVSTQDVAGMTAGQGALAAFLDDKGRVLADARVLATAEGAVVEAEHAALGGLDAAVTRVGGLAGVEVEECRWHLLRVSGDPAPLVAAGFDLPGTEHGWTESNGVMCIRVLWETDGHDLLAPRVAGLLERLIEAGAELGNARDAEAERIAAGRPRYGVDVTEETLVNETPLVERAVSFTKGCYPGQESVARVRNLGRLRTMLRALSADGEASPGAGVHHGDAGVGRVTSAAGRFALAALSSDVEPGTPVTIEPDIPAVVSNAGWR